MKDINNYILEKLKINKDSKPADINKEFLQDIVDLCGFDDKDINIYKREIENDLYKYHINEKNIKIYASSVLALSNRYHDLNYDYKKNKYINEIIYPQFDSKNILNNLHLDNNSIIMTLNGFKSYWCKDGFVIKFYHNEVDQYKIYITKDENN